MEITKIQFAQIAFEELQQARGVRIKIEAVSQDSNIVKLHPRWNRGARKKARNRQVPRRMDHQDWSAIRHL
jgi:hypothetical protein